MDIKMVPLIYPLKSGRCGLMKSGNSNKCIEMYFLFVGQLFIMDNCPNWH